jgi:hypothetical protein
MGGGENGVMLEGEATEAGWGKTTPNEAMDHRDAGAS